MKKMIALSLVMAGVFDGGVYGSSAAVGDLVNWWNGTPTVDLKKNKITISSSIAFSSDNLDKIVEKSCIFSKSSDEKSIIIDLIDKPAVSAKTESVAVSFVDTDQKITITDKTKIPSVFASGEKKAVLNRENDKKLTITFSDLAPTSSGSSSKSVEIPAAEDIAKKWEFPSLSEALLKPKDPGKAPEIIQILNGMGKRFDRAFTLQEHIKQKYDFTTFLRKANMGSFTDGYRAVVKGQSTKRIKSAKEQKFSKDAPENPSEVRFAQDWSPLNFQHGSNPQPNLEHFVRSLKFDVDTKEDGTPLAGKNIKAGYVYGTRKVSLGWFGMAPLKKGVEKRNKYKKDRKDRNTYEGIAELGGLLDCNASGLICDKPDTFFRRLKGCSMRSLYQSGGFGGCIQVAIKSPWVMRLANSGNIEGIEQDKRNAEEQAYRKISHQIVWTFVLAELLERHDARRYRNNVVRVLSTELENLKDAKFEQILTFLKEIQDNATDSSRARSSSTDSTVTASSTASTVEDKDEALKLEKIKREISLAFESVYKKSAEPSK